MSWDINNIPKGWMKAKISDLCYLGRGRVISSNEIAQNKGEYPVYSSQTSNNGIFGYLNTYDFDGEYVTWTTDGAHAGTVFYRNGKFNCTNVCGTLKAKSSDIIDMKFLSIALGLRTKSEVFIASGNPKLMNNVVAQIEIIFPESLDKQHRIAAEIGEKLFSVEKARQAAVEQLDATHIIKQAYLREAFADGKGEHVQLGDVCNKRIELISSSHNGEMVYIDISSVDSTQKRIVSTSLIPVKGAPSRAKQILTPHDILLSTVRPNLNAVAINNIYECDTLTVASTGFCILRCKPELNYKYLFYFCLSERFVNSLTNIAKGSSYPAVLASEVYEQMIPLQPIGEQRRIAAKIEERFNTVEKVTQTLIEQLDTINALPAAILRQAFGGWMQERV